MAADDCRGPYRSVAAVRGCLQRPHLRDRHPGDLRDGFAGEFRGGRARHRPAGPDATDAAVRRVVRVDGTAGEGRSGPRAFRCGRHHHALERASGDDRRQAAAGVGRRVHGGRQTCAGDAAGRHAARRVARRGRPTAGRRRGRPRCHACGTAAGGAPGSRQDRLHRQRRCGQSHRRDVRAAPGSVQSRTGRQVGGHRLRGRVTRADRGRTAILVVPEQRPGLRRAEPNFGAAQSL